MFGNALDFSLGAAVFALLGLIVGVIVGRQLPRSVASPASRSASRSPDRQSPERRERRPDGGRRNGGGGGDRDRGSRSSSPAPSGGTGLGVELYVGNLPYDTTDKELGRAFERFGRVLSVRMIENRRNGKPKGFGFVEMDTDATAREAIKAMNGADFKGRSLVVNEAKSRERDE